MNGLAGQRQIFLSNLPAGRSARYRALAVVLLSLVFFCCLVSFARRPLLPVNAFIPIYESALVINDLMTAVLLFGQFNFVRSRALLVLASAYLFTAFITIAHALSFPNVFAPTGLLGAGSQTTAWLYMFWHGGFPLFVTAYALLKNKESKEDHPRSWWQGRTRAAVFSSAAVVLMIVCGFTLLATRGHDLLPAVIINNRYTPAMIFVVSTVWGLSMLALGALLWRRHYTVLDLWLIVVLFAWLFDIGLSAVFNGGRYDLGFYAGRIYGLLAASFVLVVLLIENNLLYGRLVEAYESEYRERRHAREKTSELNVVKQELHAFSQLISQDPNAPLDAMDRHASRLEADYGQKLDAEGHRLLGEVRTKSGQMKRLVDGLMLAVSGLWREQLNLESVQLDVFVNQIVKELRASTGQRTIEFVIDRLGMAQADTALLRQVWIRLLNTAIASTRDQPVAVVKVGCRRAESIGYPHLYHVKDNGAGLTTHEIDRRFGVLPSRNASANTLDPVEKEHVEDADSDTDLSFVLHVIHRHGGRIWVDSAPGSGTTFYFTLQPEPAAAPMTGVAPDWKEIRFAV